MDIPDFSFVKKKKKEKKEVQIVKNKLEKRWLKYFTERLKNTYTFQKAVRSINICLSQCIEAEWFVMAV